MSTDTNQAQIEYWNEQTGPKWVTNQPTLDGFLAPLGAAAMDRLGDLAGARVIDVGCGCGDTTLALADRVGPRGHVLGIDVSAPMLGRAQERARGRANVAFERADAQTHRLASPPADALFSRFGVMFFADPTAAFSNLRAALRPGASLAFICWQALLKNAWCTVPLGAVAAHVPLPAPPAPGEPGPFSFGDAARVRGILEGAGFTSVHLDPLERTLSFGATGSLDETVAFLMEAGPTARVLKDVVPAVKERVQAAIADALRPYEGPNGITLDGACWIVTARNAS